MGRFKNALLATVSLACAHAFGAKVAVDVKLTPAGSFVAQTAEVKGEATQSPGGISASDVVVDATTLKTEIGLRDKHLKERLKTDQFPTIKLLKASGKDGKGSGEIEIMGKKKEVSGEYKVDGTTLKADFPLKLSELDITGVRYMGVGVKDEVVVHVELPLKAAPPAKTK